MADNVSFFGRVGAAVNAFMTTFRNPSVALSGTNQTARAGRYEYLQAWYDGTAFFNPAMASFLKSRYRLYRHTRLLWNPVPNIVNFWAGIIYPGNLSADGLPFESNKPTAVPFNDDMDASLAAAIAQIFIWSNFQQIKSVWPRYAALTGNDLLWIRDDMVSRKVYLEAEKPERIADIQTNPQGDVIMAAVQYPMRDSDASSSQEYVYRREIDQHQIRTFRNGQPYAYKSADGAIVPAVVDHPYPFCPAVWVSHQATGSIFGDGAIKSWWGTLGSLAAINSLESRMDDAIHKNVEPLTVFKTAGSITPLFERSKRGPTADMPFSDQDLDRESLPMLKAPVGTDIATIAGNLNIADAHQYLADKKADFKGHYPEYDLYPQLRAMQQVTGPAAEILLGDVATPVREIRANYDRQLIKACQMAVTVAAIRAANDWGQLDTSRDKFKAFDLQSYEGGQLDFEIVDRPLIPDPPLTEQEKLAIADLKLNSLQVPVEQVWEDIGYDQEVIAKWKAQKDANAAQMQANLAGVPGVPGTSSNPQNPGKPTLTMTQAERAVSGPPGPVVGR